jgi:hypothetical protein
VKHTPARAQAAHPAALHVRLVAEELLEVDQRQLVQLAHDQVGRAQLVQRLLPRHDHGRHAALARRLHALQRAADTLNPCTRAQVSLAKRARAVTARPAAASVHAGRRAPGWSCR